MKLLVLTMVLMLGGWMIPVDVTQAQSLPDYYPDNFQNTGVVDDIGSGYVVINDIGYRVADHVAVHGLHSSVVSFNSVNKGDRVGIFLSSASGDRPVIKEIWLLPADNGTASEE